jgi:hypothetical protein
MKRALPALALLAVLAGLRPVVFAQPLEPTTTFRVFLNDGRALASYGESTVVGQRVVFMLPVGDPAQHVELQLMSLPLTSVDMARTSRYTESVRAAHYAATRGEKDYAAMTAEVGRALDEIEGIKDAKKRLAVAEEARRRLVAWSAANYSYRAADIQELASLFDEVIAELRVAAGESKFSVNLVSGPVTQFETLQPPPSLRDSIAMALFAADAADQVDERAAILRTAAAAAADAPGAEDLRADVERRLNDEAAADRAYASLSTDLLGRADTAMQRGDVRAVAALGAEVSARDKALGSRRPPAVQALLDQLEAKLEATRAHRLALDHYEMVRGSLLAYERHVRPILSGVDGLTSVFDAIRDMSGPGFEWLQRTDVKLKRLSADLEAVKPPDDMKDVHATLVSAMRMAIQACGRRRQAIIAPNMSVAREGSAAVSGAQLLFATARESLVAQLYPPKIK